LLFEGIPRELGLLFEGIEGIPRELGWNGAAEV